MTDTFESIVRAWVALDEPIVGSEMDSTPYCTVCGNVVFKDRRDITDHLSDCLWVRAKALVAGRSASGQNPEADTP